jgi:acylphosphatase
MIAKRVEVIGRVQGVWYRARTKEQADRIGVKGWVANRADGAVEAHLEGPEELVDRLIRWMELGPPLARVEKINETAVAPERCNGFEIRR